MSHPRLLFGFTTALATASSAAAQWPTQPHDTSVLPIPRHYVCYRAPSQPIIDGRLDDAAWGPAEWTDPFVDIEGADRPAPRLRTRVKLLWDATFFYIGAELEEPDLWATITTRDAVIFHDHDFEVFLDPDGDTHEYFELEINALGTVWDLFLPQPYRDGGTADTGWDIVGLDAAVALRGTLNRPGDRDAGWTVELALPWRALAPPGRVGTPPRDGEHWHVNFSRVQWLTTVLEGRYAKVEDPATGKAAPESNWVWSPQGAINMHLPEMWGVIQFSDVTAGAGGTPFRRPDDPHVRWALRRVYYAQRAHHRQHARYAPTLQELGLADALRGTAVIHITPDGYEAAAAGTHGRLWRIRQDGRIWRE